MCDDCSSALIRTRSDNFQYNFGPSLSSRSHRRHIIYTSVSANSRLQAYKFLFIQRVLPPLALEMVDRISTGIGIHARRHFTPGRPITEPPVFDYEEFIEEVVPSDIRMKLLFPDDIEQRTKYRDTFTERKLLEMYSRSVRQMDSAVGKGINQDRFYDELYVELCIDNHDLETEFIEVEKTKTKDSLALWEFAVLDQDGGTRRLEQCLQDGLDGAWDGIPEVIEKYAYLARRYGYDERIKRRRLKEWEDVYLDNDGGTTKILELIAKGQAEVVFRSRLYPAGGDEEARAKYGYLLEQHNASANGSAIAATVATKAIIESTRELFSETSHNTPKQEQPKHKSSVGEPLLSSISRKRRPEHSGIRTITWLALLPLLALELYVIYRAYTEWTSWYS